MRKVRCEDCIRFGHESCRHETYDKCNYYPKPLGKCCVLEGEDAKRFIDHLDDPPTEDDKKMMKRVQKELKRTENEELIKLIGKMNCKNCFCDCGSSDITTCTRWIEK